VFIQHGNLSVTPVAETLEAVFTELGQEAGASSSPAGGGTQFSRGTVVFATASGNVVELRLDSEIAEAALSTPSTAPSSRGSGWIQLAGDPGNPHDLDRARAWFLSAWRNSAN
jgi:hypothetical protein